MLSWDWSISTWTLSGSAFSSVFRSRPELGIGSTWIASGLTISLFLLSGLESLVSSAGSGISWKLRNIGIVFMDHTKSIFNIHDHVKELRHRDKLNISLPYIFATWWCELLIFKTSRLLETSTTLVCKDMELENQRLWQRLNFFLMVFKTFSNFTNLGFRGCFYNIIRTRYTPGYIFIRRISK